MFLRNFTKFILGGHTTSIAMMYDIKHILRPYDDSELSQVDYDAWSHKYARYNLTPFRIDNVILTDNETTPTYDDICPAITSTNFCIDSTVSEDGITVEQNFCESSDNGIALYVRIYCDSAPQTGTAKDLWLCKNLYYDTTSASATDIFVYHALLPEPLTFTSGSAFDYTFVVTLHFY